jgi:hypothetical protein
MERWLDLRASGLQTVSGAAAGRWWIEGAVTDDVVSVSGWELVN